MPPKDATGADQVVGARIASLRKAKGLSQADIGDVVGVSFQQIRKYELGLNRVGAGRLQVIAKFLDVPVAMLFGDEAETVISTNAFDILNLAGSTELLEAFAKIEDPQMRRDILALVRTAARMRAQPGTDGA